ncbi:MAG: JAB domain-containing protein [Ruminococcus sp.]
MSSTNGNTSVKKILTEKYVSGGLDSLTQQEIIQLILAYSGCKDTDVISMRLCSDYGTLSALIDADIQTLSSEYGLNEQAIVLLRLISQVSRHYLKKEEKITCLRSSSAAVKFFRKLCAGADEENLFAACTNEKFRIISHRTIAAGSEQSIHTVCRNIADFALVNKSGIIFIAHNHPNSAAAPSMSDFSSTREISLALDKIGIMLADHIIIGSDSAVSMREISEAAPFFSGIVSGYLTNKRE